MTTLIPSQASLSAFTLQEAETAIEFHNWSKYRDCLSMWFPHPWYTSIIQHYTQGSGTTGHGVLFSMGHICNTTLQHYTQEQVAMGSLLHGIHLQHNTVLEAQEQLAMGYVYNTTLPPRFWKYGGRGDGKIVMSQRTRTSGMDNVFSTWEASCTCEIPTILSPKQYPNKYNIKE